MSFRALKLCGSGGPPHVKLIIEWEHRIKDWSVSFPLHYCCISITFCCVILHILCNKTLDVPGHSLFGNIQEEVVKDAESARNLQQQHVQQHSCTLDECFQLYTKEEQVVCLILLTLCIWNKRKISL